MSFTVISHISQLVGTEIKEKMNLMPMIEEKAYNLRKKQSHSATLKFSGSILTYLPRFDSDQIQYFPLQIIFAGLLKIEPISKAIVL